MIKEGIHLNYNSDNFIPWLISLKDSNNYTATPMKFEKNIAADYYTEEYERHIRLVMNAYHILKNIACHGVKKIDARYYCNALPAMLITMELDTGDKAEVTINLYAPGGWVELTSNREICNFEVFKHNNEIEMKPTQKSIFKPVSRHLYVIDINHLLHMFENNPDISESIKLLFETANEISKEVLK